MLANIYALGEVGGEDMDIESLRFDAGDEELSGEEGFELGVVTQARCFNANAKSL